MVLKCTNGTKLFWSTGNLKLFLFITLFRFEINKGCLHSQAHLLYYLGLVDLNKSNVDCDLSPEEAEGMRTVLHGKYHSIYAVFDGKHTSYFSDNLIY